MTTTRTGAPAPAFTPTATKSRRLDERQIRADIRRIREFIEAIEAAGGRMPELRAAVNRLSGAVETGVQLAEAAEETRQALAAYTADLHRACGLAEDEYACMAGVDRQWQRRSVEWVLSWEKQDSTVRRFVESFLRSRTPQAICRRLEWCRRDTR